MNIVVYFFLYSFLGWLAESIYCSIPKRMFINRGFLAGPYCPIYGCGALLTISILNPFRAHLLFVFLIGILVTSVLEYSTSYLMQLIFHTKWWDYSSYPFNLHGRICLKNSLFFGCMVTVLIYGINPFVTNMISNIPIFIIPFSGWAFLCIFIYDTWITSQAIIHKNKAFQEVQKSIYLLYIDFKNTNIASMHAGLNEALQKVLNSTNVDERIVSHIDKVKDRISMFYNMRKKTFERLSKAFPTKIENHAHIDMDTLLSIISKYRKKDK